MIAIVLVALTYALIRLRYFRHAQNEQAAIIKQQQGVINEQREQLQQQHAATAQQSSEDTRRLASIYQELQQANQDIEIFLYKAYHNFLGPIATIRGICQVAKMESEAVSRLDYFDKVRNVADNMHSMLEQLLEVSTIHDRELVVEPTGLSAFFANMERELSENTTYPAVRIRHRFSKTDQVVVDNFLLRQAVTKIVSNTALFRRTGGHDSLELTVSHEKIDNVVIISLRDDHLTIPAEVSSDIFRMFYRGTQQANDHGLGLYTARYAMRRMGGDILLSSRRNATVFSLTLPGSFNHRYQEFLEVPVEQIADKV
jgi:signal transduction histidine kinase